MTFDANYSTTSAYLCPQFDTLLFVHPILSVVIRSCLGSTSAGASTTYSIASAYYGSVLKKTGQGHKLGQPFVYF